MRSVSYYGILNLCFVFLAACSSGPCKIEDRPKDLTQSTEEIKNQINKGSLLARVKIYKFDGSLQCNQGKKVSPDDMAKELKDIPIYSRDNKHDGLMRIQLCGKPTGYCNVFEIDAEKLPQAEKLGYKKWVRD
jgi:hypothetical protein